MRTDDTTPLLPGQHSTTCSIPNGYMHATLRFTRVVALVALGAQLETPDSFGAEVYSFRVAAPPPVSGKYGCVLERRYDQSKGDWWLSYPARLPLHLVLYHIDMRYATPGLALVVAYRHLGRLADEARHLRVIGLLRKQREDEVERDICTTGVRR